MSLRVKYFFKMIFQNHVFPGPKRDQFLFLGTPCSSKNTNELLQSGDYGNSVLRKDNNVSADSLPQIDALTFLLRKQRFLFCEGSDLSSRVDCIFYLRKLEELLDDLKELHKQISELVYHTDSLASGYSYSESVSMENSISDRIDFLLLKINQNSGHLPSVSNSFDFSKNKTFVFHNPTDVKPFVFGNDVPLNSKKVNPLMSCNTKNSLNIYSKDVFSSFDSNTVKELDFKSDLITNGKFIFDFEWSDEPFNQSNLKSKSSSCEDLEMFCRNDNSFDNVQKDAFGPFGKSDKNNFTFDFEWSDEPFNQNNFKSESSTYVDLEIKIPEYAPFVSTSSEISASPENVKLDICYEKDLVQINSDNFNHSSNNCPVTTSNYDKNLPKEKKVPFVNFNKVKGWQIFRKGSFQKYFFKLVSTSANHKKYRFLKQNFNFRNFKPNGKCFTVQVKKRERFRIVFTEDPLTFYSKLCFRIRTKIKRKLTGLTKNIETISHKFSGRKTQQPYDPYIFGKKCARFPILYDNIARYPPIFWIVRPIPFREFESNCNLQFKYLNNICGI
ncbi:hypothetical protein ACFFRR_011579 [Megaselia abdita]